jgi:hypothetical protein
MKGKQITGHAIDADIDALFEEIGRPDMAEAIISQYYDMTREDLLKSAIGMSACIQLLPMQVCAFVYDYLIDHEGEAISAETIYNAWTDMFEEDRRRDTH